jgi:hypothetical protein
MTPAEEIAERPANHLAGQASPYLRAHAHDPVAWVPWGERALRFARKTGRPLLISVGYHSCHWCHVMQRESFSDPDTAGFINRHFVPIKVDREARPDVDAFYMTYLNLSTGSGGWPMTIFATPDGDPFYGGTYFPPAASKDTSSLDKVLDAVLRAWTLSRDTTLDTARESMDLLRETQAGAFGTIDRDAIERAAAALRDLDDRDNGGFGSAPKFPQVPAAGFLLAYAASTGETWPLDLVRRQALAMLRGGIFDHVGGGLFRYSTDATWHVPHFEKMLYDQGLLLSLLAALHRLDPCPEFASCARATHAFLVRELARADGGLNAALDAETDGVEGASYTWDSTELESALTAEELELAHRHLGLPENGAGTQVVLTRRAGRETDADSVDALLERLFELRSTRRMPDATDHAITAWNALAARGLLEAGDAFADASMTATGLETLEWLLGNATQGEEVVRIAHDPDCHTVRFLDDHAALAAACISAAGVTGDTRLLDRAASLQASAISQFSAGDGGFAMCTGDTALPFSPLEVADNATPSGAALLAENAVRLASAGRGDAGIVASATAQFARTAHTLPYLAGHALAATVLDDTRLR